MLAEYRSNQRKIAMGLLSFHRNLKDQQHLLKEIDTYEQNEQFQLYCYYCEGNENVQGVIGVELTAEGIVVHDISLNPSYRGEGLGFEMLNELQALYPEQTIYPTKMTETFIQKWRARK
ncbi:GNAT family N-acetyltransferase [Enterococcus sp. CSURQ0835]|uniref:GNAT family N-acetyltransferase n=1 Tax=Enterococcus sp. CSURQ0835 TaxID=2681394 RepID=UPI00135A81EF|nr:GNAT family N-acetyltransferase [Enterococcus sp. CSURQ0835]